MQAEQESKRVIVGLGATGVSCARYFYQHNIPFSIVDSRAEPPGVESFFDQYPDVDVSLGDISAQALQAADELIVSPGVALEEPAIAEAIAAGKHVCGDIDIFRREVEAGDHKAPIVAITGSNGKSTVTTLLGDMIAADDKAAAVGGNIGVPALDLLLQETPDFYVLELSSFQLERCEPLGAEVAVVLNLSADHMDRYQNMQAYHRAKHKVFQGCKQIVVNRGDDLSKPLQRDGVKMWSFGVDKPDFNGFGLLEKNQRMYLAFEFECLMPVSDLKVIGRHNVENVLAALALGRAIGLSFPAMLKAVKDFRGLKHRCQFVDEVAAVRFYNDSKGTNVAASIAAIQACADALQVATDNSQTDNHRGQLVVIAGGVGKGADFSDFVDALLASCRCVVLIGEAADELQGLLTGAKTRLKVKLAADLDEAVAMAHASAEAGDIVLLSPACASMDMFADYQQRGDCYMQAVARLAGASGS